MSIDHYQQSSSIKRSANRSLYEDDAEYSYGFFLDKDLEFQSVRVMVESSGMFMRDRLTGEYSTPVLESQFVTIKPESEFLSFISREGVSNECC